MMQSDELEKNEEYQENEGDRTEGSPIEIEYDLENTIKLPNDGLIYELWPTSCKVFELDIKNTFHKDTNLIISSIDSPGPLLTFSNDRKSASFESSLTIHLDTEGKNKFYVQISVEIYNEELEFKKSIRLREESSDRSIDIPVVVKVDFPY